MKKYFTNCETLDELKAAYRRAAMENHPDRGGSTEAMQEINNEYAARFEELKRVHNAKAQANAEAHDDSTAYTTTECPEDFIQIISLLLSLEGLTVELCGRWLWIGGDTRKHSDRLKAAGCRWCSKKKLWSWHHEEDWTFHSKTPAKMEDIRRKYGSATFTRTEQELLHA